MSHAQPEPITPPENFPVSWQSPEDARLHWTLDRMHFPDPVTPMLASVSERTFDEGRTRAAQAQERPVGRYCGQRINTYFYQHVAPLALPPEQIKARGQRFLQRADAAVLHYDQYWDGYLTEIKQQLVAWDAVDLATIGLDELWSHLDETVVRAARVWEIHFLVAPFVFYALNQFEEYYCDLFPEHNALDAYRLVQGFSNKTIETGHALWTLSRQVQARPELREALSADSTIGVLRALTSSAAGQTFLSSLRDFLAAYGQRFDKMDWTTPSWVEDPTAVLNSLREFSKPDAVDPVEQTARLAAEREQAVAGTREAMQAYPEPMRARFESLLKSAQSAPAVMENHNFYIDQAAMFRVRRVILECGRRLSALGVFDAAEDVFFLTLDELKDAASASPGDLRSAIAARKAEMAYWARVTPPDQLGARASAPPVDNAFSRAIGKFFASPPPPSTEPDVLRGHVGSAGVVRGAARVIHTLSESAKLRLGDVLVAATTTPPWTPLFAIAGAVVTDTGGVLSHCAVVAREYRIPAVVGTGNATQRIHDGQLIEVDGSAGVVRLLE